MRLTDRGRSWIELKAICPLAAYSVATLLRKLTREHAVNQESLRARPIVDIRVDTQKAEITGLDTPPPYVRWGNISTPPF